MASLISEQTNTKLDELVTMFFAGNRLADRGMSELDVKFVMNKTATILHSKIAHFLPALADIVSDYQGSRNAKTVYGLTPRDETEYSRPLEFFQRLLVYMIDLESFVFECYETAKEDNDFMTKSFLESFILKLNPLTKQCLLLVDKATLYEDMMLFDENIESFIIL
jgi:ferritin